MLLTTLILAVSPALACTMLAPRPDLGLPGAATAGPEAMFSVESMSVTLWSGEAEVPVRHVIVEAQVGGKAVLLDPEAPLAPGEYRLEPCGGTDCTTTIVADAGDPGVAPEPPTITTEPTRVWSGRNADCGPMVGATILTVETDAAAVVFAESPVDELDGAVLLGTAIPDEDGVITWTTRHEGEVFAAAVDAEGELSEWKSLTLEPGCSTTGRGPLGIAGLLIAAGLARSRGRMAR